MKNIIKKWRNIHKVSWISNYISFEEMITLFKFLIITIAYLIILNIIF